MSWGVKKCSKGVAEIKKERFFLECLPFVCSLQEQSNNLKIIYYYDGQQQKV